MEYPFPVRCPAHAEQSAPVWAALRPCVSTIPTCRCAIPESASRSARSTSGAGLPFRSIASPSGPNDSLVDAWVAIAPVPASAHGTAMPTLNARDWTATPISCVTESYATIENVARAGAAVRSAAATHATARTRTIAKPPALTLERASINELPPGTA